MAERTRSTRLSWPLLGLGAVMLALACAERSAQIAHINNRSAAFLLLSALPFLAAAWVIWRAPASRGTLLFVLGVALAMRLLALFSPPSLSTDINRYIWDGRVQAAGINPYVYRPADPALSWLRDDEVYPNINRKDYAKTIYPPFAQMVYFLTTRISTTVFWMKATMLLFDLAAIIILGRLLVLAGLAPQRLLLYAWHPLPVWELTGAGHVDAVLIAALSLSLLAAWQGKKTLTGLALAAGFLVKFFPLALLPVFHRQRDRRDWRLPITFAGAVLVAYLPYYLTAGAQASPRERLQTVLGFVFHYTQEEGLRDGSGFFLLKFFPPLLWLRTVYLALGAGVLLTLALYVWRTPPRDAFSLFRRGLAMIAAVIVISSPHYAWYVCWAIPFLCFVPSRAMFWISLAMPALYITLEGASWNVFLWANAIIYFPAAALAIYDFRKPIHL